ncbi:MAG: acylphosphatase [Microvirga sp.]|jgi:acylphosphatase|nr:acylphosphatase [Microvirga sp.]
MQTVRLIVHGRVQGVGYRAFLADEAERLGLRGWVRNRADGTVEAVVGGGADIVEALVAACRRGPRLARVTTIDVLPADGEPLPEGFDHIRAMF